MSLCLSFFFLLLLLLLLLKLFVSKRSTKREKSNGETFAPFFSFFSLLLFSSSNIFFVHSRIGKDGKKFDYYKKVKPGIIDYYVDNDDYTSLLKEFAGPKQNFYYDLHDTKISWITQTLYKHVPSITKTTTYGETKTLDPFSMKEV